MTAGDQPVRDYADLDELLDHLEELVRTDAHRDPASGRIHVYVEPHVEALRILARHGRFRIVTEIGRKQMSGFFVSDDPRGAA